MMDTKRISNPGHKIYIFVAACLIPLLASAQAFYNYQSGPIISGANLGESVLGVIELAVPLVEGTQAVTPLAASFSLSDGTAVMPNSLLELTGQGFEFTVAGGSIIGFAFKEQAGTHAYLAASSDSGELTSTQHFALSGSTFTAPAGGWTSPIVFNTSESKTGGGGALELMLLLSVMGVARGRRPTDLCS